MAPLTLEDLERTYGFMSLDRNLEQAYRLYTLSSGTLRNGFPARRLSCASSLTSLIQSSGTFKYNQDPCLPSTRKYADKLFTFLHTEHIKWSWHHPVIKARTHAIENPDRTWSEKTKKTESGWWDGPYEGGGSYGGAGGGGSGASYTSSGLWDGPDQGSGGCGARTLPGSFSSSSSAADGDVMNVQRG
ncbi:hypothetical protein BC567DRAFT_6417 [Phyllosticta citribraziliensis]